MKIKIYVSLIVINLFTCINSQISKDLILPFDKDDIIKSRVNYNDKYICNDTCIWDFTKVKTIDENYGVKYFILCDSIIRKENYTQYYSKITNNHIQLIGFENNTTKIEYIIPEIELRFPFVLNDTFSSYFFAKGNYSGRYNFYSFGKYQYNVDKIGILISPEKDTLYDVIRVKIEKEFTQRIFSELNESITDTIDFIEKIIQKDSLTMKSINYKWYKKGYRYPLFEVNKNSIIEKNEEGVKEKDFSNLAFYYSPFEQFYHRNDPDNLNELEEITEESKVILWNKFSNNTHKTNDNNTARDKKSNKNTNSNIEKDFEKSFNLVINNIYPIPVNNNLNIDFSVNQHSEIIFSIINANSKILYKNKQVFHPGNYNNKIAVDFLIDGYYILRIQCKDEITEIKIIKNSLI